MNSRHPSGLYLITPDQTCTARLLADTRLALEAGITWLQYRNKNADAALRHEQAVALQSLCADFGIPLIVNDDVLLARAAGAAGVHLGEHDGDIAAARRTLGPDAIIGATCYDDIERARRAATTGANYIAFGAFFPSPTKPAARRATPQLLQDAATLDLPLVAIGGITPDNGKSLTAAGANLLAVISSVYAAPDITAAVHAYHLCFPSRT